jgi:3-oxoacyl-[acyl-carrier protein] reductase
LVRAGITHRGIHHPAMNLTDKTIVITGAAQGIGRAMAVAFAAAGSNLGLIDLNAERLTETAGLCEASGGEARAFIANVADEAEIETAFDAIVANFGRLDGPINNAGVLRDGLLDQSTWWGSRRPNES